MYLARLAPQNQVVKQVGAGGPLERVRLKTVDPRGVISSCIEMRRVLGSIFYPSLDIVEPGVIERIPGSDRISIGEPDASSSSRCDGISDVLRAAGLNCTPTTQIRWELWDKLLGSGTYNILGAITRASLMEMRNSAELRPVAHAMMEEMNAVATQLGISGLDVNRKVAAGTGTSAGHHKMSMLQDLELGRPLELEGMVGVVLELGEILGLSLPFTAGLYACARMLDESARERSS